MKDFIKSIITDREVGTQTEWTFQTVKTSCGVCHKIGPFKYNNGKETSACVYEDYPWTTPHRMSEPEANARRIARVPEMEAAIIAAENLALAFDKFDEVGCQQSVSDLYQARAAYRDATT